MLAGKATSSSPAAEDRVLAGAGERAIRLPAFKLPTRLVAAVTARWPRRPRAGRGSIILDADARCSLGNRTEIADALSHERGRNAARHLVMTRMVGS